MSYRPSVIAALLALLATPASAGNVIDPYTLFPSSGGGAIAYGGQGTIKDLQTDHQSVSPIAIDMPDGMAAGGLAIAAIVTQPSIAVTTAEPGWTRHPTAGFTHSVNGSSLSIFSHPITTPGSEPTSVNFSANNNTYAYKGVIIWFENATTVADIQCTDSGASSTTTPTTPNATPGSDPGMLVYFYGDRANFWGANPIITIPGTTAISSSASGSYRAALGIGYTPSTGTSPTGADSWALTGGSYYLTCTMAIH